MKPRNRYLAKALLTGMAIAAIGVAGAATTGAKTSTDPHLALNASDHSFLSDAMDANQKEIDASLAAEKLASSAKVKQFAQTIVSDHTRLGADLQKVNDGSIPKPVRDTQLNPNLQDRTGADFDKAYMDLMVTDHGLAVALFEGAATGPQDTAAVRAMANAALPTIRRHEVMARELDQSLSSSH